MPPFARVGPARTQLGGSMNTNRSAAGKWKLRPFEPRCKTFVDPVGVVDEQIRCRVPVWTGNFDEVKPELIAQGLRLDDLPRLTVHDIGQFVIRAAQGGSLQCGPVGTAKHDIVTALPIALTADDALYEWAADTLDDEHWKILELCKSKGFVERATAQSEERITAYVVGGGDKLARGVLPDMRRQFDLLKKRNLIRREKGVGTWLSRQGAELLRTRQAKLNRLCVV